MMDLIWSAALPRADRIVQASRRWLYARSPVSVYPKRKQWLAYFFLTPPRMLAMIERNPF